MVKKILIGLVVIVVGFVAYAYTRPDTYHVERATKIDAPAPVVFAQIDDFKAWGAWSPWEKLDPAMKKTYDGPPRGVGSSYAWQGNDKVGKGKMTVTESQPPTQLGYRLEFIEPFAAVANTTFTIKPEGEKAATVTWAMDGTNNLIAKAFGIFMNMDQTIGGDFDKGLAALKTVSEADAKKQAEAMAKAQAEAAAAAEAAKAQATAAAPPPEPAAPPKGKAKGKGKH